jgi:hypothetical protein
LFTELKEQEEECGLQKAAEGNIKGIKTGTKNIFW